jgi:hypothetical protein
MKFNAFGMVTIQHNKLIAILTAIVGKKDITRTITDESVVIEAIPQGNSIVLTIGVNIQEKTSVTVHEIGSQEQQSLMAEIPQVRAIIAKVIDMTKKGAGIE